MHSIHSETSNVKIEQGKRNIFIAVMIYPQLATKYHRAALSLTPSGIGERIRRVKVRKLVG